MSRPGWDEFYLGVAIAVSRRGDCFRSQVGAVVVDSKNRVVSLGYNGFEPGQPGCYTDGVCPRAFSVEVVAGQNYYESGCTSTHAEVNAFYNSPRDLDYCTIYVTRRPCSGCWQFLTEEGVNRFVFPGGELGAYSD